MKSVTLNVTSIATQDAGVTGTLANMDEGYANDAGSGEVLSIDGGAPGPSNMITFEVENPPADAVSGIEVQVRAYFSVTGWVDDTNLWSVELADGTDARIQVYASGSNNRAYGSIGGDLWVARTSLVDISALRILFRLTRSAVMSGDAMRLNIGSAGIELRYNTAPMPDRLVQLTRPAVRRSANW
jgi:hypothetical protein